MFEKYPDIITIQELCEMLHIGKDKAYVLLRTELIKSVRIGKKFIIPKKSVIEFLQIDYNNN